MTAQARFDPSIWRPQGRFVASVASLRQLQAFNDTGGVAVNFDVMRSAAPDLKIMGSQSLALSLWETRSASGFVTKPKFNSDLVTIRFVTSGHVVYRHRTGDAVGSPTHATLVGFEDLREVQASPAFDAISATITTETLAAASAALTGEEHRGLPPLAPVAEIVTPGMRALFCTVWQIHRRIQDADGAGDLMLPLVQEIMGYQLLSAWPKREQVAAFLTQDVSSRSLQVALDYIASNLSAPLVLADIAAAAGISVRSLQDKFRREIGRTPVQFITDQRLARAHADLLSPRVPALPIADIARRWGFVHTSDFGQRYRKLYGCTPSETRRAAGGDL